MCIIFWKKKYSYSIWYTSINFIWFWPEFNCYGYLSHLFKLWQRLPFFINLTTRKPIMPPRRKGLLRVKKLWKAHWGYWWEELGRHCLSNKRTEVFDWRRLWWNRNCVHHMWNARVVAIGIELTLTSRSKWWDRLESLVLHITSGRRCNNMERWSRQLPWKYLLKTHKKVTLGRRECERSLDTTFVLCSAEISERRSCLKCYIISAMKSSLSHLLKQNLHRYIHEWLIYKLLNEDMFKCNQ